MNESLMYSLLGLLEEACETNTTVVVKIGENDAVAHEDGFFWARSLREASERYPTALPAVRWFLEHRK